MKKFYRINGAVSFFPNNSHLVSSSGQKVKLNSPTNELFKVFISRVGEVIPQNELYSLAWGEAGANVTPNTLYQNISLLRKAMQDVGLDGECLKTIRGKGFIFNATNVTEHNAASLNVSNIRKMGRFYLIIITVIFLIISIIVISKLNGNDFSSVKNGFKFYSKIDDCSVYVNQKTNISEYNLKSIYGKKSSTCAKFPIVYMQLTSTNTPISITSCAKDILMENNSCVTELIYNYKENETNEK